MPHKNDFEIIGLTGQSGSGKGEVANILAKKGFAHIDADAVYRDVITPPSPCLDELKAAFGDFVISPDGTLDRSALAEHVFAEGNGNELKKLNSITHKYVIARSLELCGKYKSEGKIAAVIDAPLLFEANMQKLCDRIICVIADKGVRMERIMQRDGLTHDAAAARIAAQNSDDLYVSNTKKHRYHAIIYNNGTADDLASSTMQMLHDWGYEI